MDWRALHLLCVAALVVALGSHSAAQNLSRQVIINGALMNDTQLTDLDGLNCGAPVPDGQYWLNVNTGAWGFQGGPHV